MIENELYDLVHAGDLPGVSKWLDQTPDDLNNFVSDGYAPLHVACLFGHEAIVHHLINRGALVNLNAMNASRATPLHLAVMFRDEETAKRMALYLLNNGAELNAKQDGGQTPLHHAVARGSVILVKALIEEGADPFFEDDLKRSPTDIAKELKGESAEQVDEIRSSLKRAFSLPLESRT